MCTFSTPEISHLQNHIYTIHRDDPNFHVYCSICSRSYKKLSAYRKHVSRGCKQEKSANLDEVEDHSNQSTLELTPETESDRTCNDNDSSQVTDESYELDKQWLEARYILGLKERYSLSQAAVDYVVSSTASLMSTLIDSITSKTIDPKQALAMITEKAKSMFAGLSSAFRQRKYFVETFQLVVSC